MTATGTGLRVLMTADAVGGVWSYALTLATALGRLADRPVADMVLAVLGPPPSPAQRAQAAAIPHLRLVELPSRLEWMDEPWDDVDAAGSRLQCLAIEHRADIIHLNGYSLAAAGWRAPVVVVGHSCVLSWSEAVNGEPAPPSWDEYRRRVRHGLAGADAVVAPTRAMLDALARHYGLPRGGQVIANGHVRAQTRPCSKEPIVLSAGRLWDAAKGLDALDAAASRLAWPVYVAGDCRHPERGKREPRHARALDLLSFEALAEWMGRAAIYAHPARYEPFGLAVLEAAAAGCALVLGDIASLRELWEGVALFVSPGEPSALAGSIAALLRDDERRRRLARDAQHRASAFTADRMARAYADLYCRLAACRTGQPASAMASAG